MYKNLICSPIDAFKSVQFYVILQVFCYVGSRRIEVMLFLVPVRGQLRELADFTVMTELCRDRQQETLSRSRRQWPRLEQAGIPWREWALIWEDELPCMRVDFVTDEEALLVTLSDGDTEVYISIITMKTIEMLGPLLG